MKLSIYYCNPCDFEDRKDWFRYVREIAKEEAEEDFKSGAAQECPFKDYDATGEYEAFYEEKMKELKKGIE